MTPEGEGGWYLPPTTYLNTEGYSLFGRFQKERKSSALLRLEVPKNTFFPSFYCTIFDGRVFFLIGFNFKGKWGFPDTLGLNAVVLCLATALRILQVPFSFDSEGRSNPLRVGQAGTPRGCYLSHPRSCPLSLCLLTFQWQIPGGVALDNVANWRASHLSTPLPLIPPHPITTPHRPSNRIL